MTQGETNIALHCYYPNRCFPWIPGQGHFHPHLDPPPSRGRKNKEVELYIWPGMTKEDSGVSLIPFIPVKSSPCRLHRSSSLPGFSPSRSACPEPVEGSPSRPIERFLRTPHLASQASRTTHCSSSCVLRSVFCVLLKKSIDLLPTVPALPVHHIIFEDPVPVPVDDKFTARGAECVLPGVPRDVASINVL